MAAVQLRLDVGDLAGADVLLQGLLQRQPDLAAAWRLRSALAPALGRPGEALPLARQAALLAPQDAEVQTALGRALRQAGQLDAAIAAYRQALDQRPDLADTWVSLGIALRQAGRLDEAIESHRRALALKPDQVEALGNLGNALAQRIHDAVDGQVSAEDLREAEAVQRRALALSPRHAGTMHNLGLLLKMTGRYEEAVDLFNRALAQDPRRMDTCLAFGDLLAQAHRQPLAADLYQRWLAEQGEHLPVRLALAQVCHAQQRLADAQAHLARVLQAQPDHALAQVLQRRWLAEAEAGAEGAGASAGADAEGLPATLRGYEAMVAARPTRLEAVAALLMTRCYLDEDPRRLAQEHQAHMAPLLAHWPAPQPLPAAASSQGRPLRVGLVSPDLRQHSVAYFLGAWLAALDPAQVHLRVYQSQVPRDAMTARLQALAPDWHEVGSLSDEDLAARMRADHLDIALDLAGLTAGSRLGVFARRVAPCQLTWLGYPAAMGTGAGRIFDGRITDGWIDPPGQAQPGDEPALRLPAPFSMFCYRPGVLPPEGPLPALARGALTFGSFNNESKLGDATLDLWCPLLQALPQSRLLLKANALESARVRSRVQARLAARGIAPDRLLLLGPTTRTEDHLSTYQQVDIALDPTPYNGATTSCEALVMGVPVLSLAGRTAPGRMGLSILRAAGLGDWVVDDAEQLLQLALHWAAHLPRLAALRTGLRAQVMASPLADGPGFAAALHHLLRQAHEQAGG